MDKQKQQIECQPPDLTQQINDFMNNINLIYKNEVFNWV